MERASRPTDRDEVGDRVGIVLEQRAAARQHDQRIPVLYDEADKPYKTAQSFGELNSSPSYSCAFSFRVPKGAKLSRFAIGDASFDVASFEK